MVEFEHHKWSNPSILFAYFKRPPPGQATHDAIRRADIYSHTLDMMMHDRHDSHRLRRSRVSLTDFLDVEQREALKAFAGCIVNDVSPSCPDDCASQKYRFITGSCNNRQRADWGASNMPQRRLLMPIYEDELGNAVGSDPAVVYNGFTLPLVRAVSNVVGGERIKQSGQDELYNHIMTVWGQYIDHDMDLTPQSKAITTFQGLDYFPNDR